MSCNDNILNQLFTFNRVPDSNATRSMVEGFMKSLDSSPEGLPWADPGLASEYYNVGMLTMNGCETQFGSMVLNDSPIEKRGAVLQGLVHLNRELFNNSEEMRRAGWRVNRDNHLEAHGERAQKLLLQSLFRENQGVEFTGPEAILQHDLRVILYERGIRHAVHPHNSNRLAIIWVDGSEGDQDISFTKRGENTIVLKVNKPSYIKPFKKLLHRTSDNHLSDEEKRLLESMKIKQRREHPDYTIIVEFPDSEQVLLEEVIAGSFSCKL